MSDPILTENVLTFDGMAPGTVVHVTDPDFLVTQWPVENGPLTLTKQGTFILGIEEAEAHPRRLEVRVTKSAADKLTEWRNAQVMDRDEFAIAAWQAKLISEQDAEAWATGSGVPKVIADAIATLSPAAQAKARIKMRGTLRVRRMSPEFEFLRKFMGLTEAAGDALFGTPPT